MRWQQGRQGTGYRKLLLARGRRFDLWLLHFPTGSHVPEHRDAVTRGRHVRVNLVLRQAASGGEFRCAQPIVDWSRLKVFRSDLCEHAVTRIKRGNRWVLSFGVKLPP